MSATEGVAGALWREKGQDLHDDAAVAAVAYLLANWRDAAPGVTPETLREYISTDLANVITLLIAAQDDTVLDRLVVLARETA